MNLANPFLENISPAGLLANQSIKNAKLNNLNFNKNRKNVSMPLYTEWKCVPPPKLKQSNRYQEGVLNPC